MAQDFGFSDPAELVGKTDIDLFGEEFGQLAPATGPGQFMADPNR